MNCVLYARVSTDKQAEKELSIPAQLQAMRDYARQRDWNIVAEFIEPGASAKTTERPELQRLLSLVRGTEPTVDVVLVHKIDRLARNVYDHATIKALLKQRDVRLASVVENMDDSVSGQLVENIMASIAQFYSANLGDEVRKGMRQKVLKGGWPHQPPRGYVPRGRGENKTTDGVAIHPREGPIMRRAFELYATGVYSIKALASRLANDGLTTKSGRPLATSYLRRLLTNPFYTGRLHWGDIDAPGSHSPLVSAQLFEKVQTVIADRYRNPGVKGSIEGFPLRGVAICASCRGRMTAERHQRWGYYRCGRNAYSAKRCRAKFCNAQKADADLERLCQQIRLTRPMLDSLLTAAQRLIDDRTRQASESRLRLEKEQIRLLETEMHLTDAFTAGDVSSDLYRTKTRQVRVTRTRLQQELERTAVDPTTLMARVTRTLQVASSMSDLFHTLQGSRRTALLREVFAVVVLSSDGIVGFKLKPPFDTLASAAGNDPRKLLRKNRDQLLHAIIDAA